MSDLLEFARISKEASRKMAVLTEDVKNLALSNIALSLMDTTSFIYNANDLDLKAAIDNNLDKTLLKRLAFDDAKIKDVVSGIKGLISLPDPVGRTLLHTTLDDELDLYRVSCPIGVIGMIFESRPDALVQIASLCVKSGNAVILKGGSEAINTNKALAEVIYRAGVSSGLPEGWLHLITTREDVNTMLTLDDYIDLIIPRGSNSFVQYIMNNTNIPVMGHADGVCHTYINSEADFDLALKVSIDAKTQYVSVCNCTETFLVDSSIKDSFLPLLIEKLKEHNVEIFGDEYVSSTFNCEPVEDWHHEYLDYKASVKIVNDVNDAIEHINKYGSAHTDSIITTNIETAELFMNSVDSANVYMNCSTRFADGFRYGFGAEVGVSTSKLHARGPVGLEGLVTYKYKLYGNGHIVDDYAKNIKNFKHIRRDI